MATSEASALKHAFSPLTVRGRTMRNRFVHAPMSVGYADHQGRATRSMAEHYGRRAQGGAGMVITENVAVSAMGRQMPKQPMLGEEVAVEGFAEVANEIKRHGALAVMQVVHAGRYAGPWDVYDQARRIAPSAISFPLLPGREVTPDEITLEEIAQSLEEFGRTARLAEAAGFDGIEIHAAQGFLISQFLSPRMNRRIDQWGGDFDHRTAYLRAVIDHVRGVVSSEFIVGLHLISDEWVDGGWTVAEACRLAPIVAAAGIDFIMPVAATFETMRLPQNAGMMNRPLFQHAQAAAIKQVSPVPVFSNGGIHDPELAEHLLANSEADAIGLARPLFADPDWVAKVGAGRHADLRLCACNPPTCLLTQLSGSICECWPDTAKAQGWLGYAA